MIWVALISLCAWLYLLLGRGMFWLTRERDDDDSGLSTPSGGWPSVVAVVPARDEADVLPETLGSLLRQDYPGSFRVVLVDDQSSDGTGAIAAGTIDKAARQARDVVLAGSPRPPGWAGKVWAMQQGVEAALKEDVPEYFLFTDADIAHAPDTLRRLVVRAQSSRLVLVSLMAKLHCKGLVEDLLIPAFVFFFAMLFPFAWANDPARRTAAAAGGCMLARKDALLAAGGVEAIRKEIIDDCALARVMKQQGPIWLGLTERARSVRPYGGFAEIRRMISRSAYAQLGFSPLILAGTLAGMVFVYAAPPLLAVLAGGAGRIAGALAWVLMALAFQPMLRFYRISPLWGLALPLTGALYASFTLDSALQFWRGKGGTWKGRAQAIA